MPASDATHPSIKQRLRTLLRKESEHGEPRKATVRKRDEWTQELISAYASSSYNGIPVFFVAGRAKSGTGWLMKLLNFHPEVLCKGEGRFFGRGRENENLKNMQTGETVLRRKIQPSSLHRAISSSEYLRLWIERSVWTRNDDLDEHLNNLTRVAINYFLLQDLAETGKRMVGDKTPLGTPEILKDIGEIHPQAKVIHIVRDGRDQAASWMHHLWKGARDRGGQRDIEPEEVAKREAFYEDREGFLSSGESIFTEDRLRQAAEIWRDIVSGNRTDGAALIGDNYTEVRYEDLLENPVREAGRLFEFLGADTDESIVRRCVKSASFEKLSGRERGSEDYTLDFRKHRKGIAGDWANVFTERDKDIYKEVAGELLIELGYEEDNGW